MLLTNIGKLFGSTVWALLDVTSYVLCIVVIVCGEMSIKACVYRGGIFAAASGSVGRDDSLAGWFLPRGVNEMNHACQLGE